MKISELNPLAQLQEAAQIPVVVSGENRSITLGQILNALQACVVPFSRINRNMRTVYAVGSSAVIGSIVFDAPSKKFYNCLMVSSKEGSDMVTRPTLYSEWEGKDSFYSGEDVRTNCLFISAEGRLYRFSGEDLISAGLTDEQAQLLTKLTPQPVESESALDAMKAAGEIVPGQIYYIPEAE